MNGKFIILEWQIYSPVNVVSNEEGETLYFSEAHEAEKWAEENCAFNWKVVNLYEEVIL